MKKKIIITGIVVALAFVFLIAINQISTKVKKIDYYTEVQKGQFEISITAAGELLAEKSMDINGPEIATGRDIRFMNIKITDLISEGTLVKEGDYVATLDRTELNNNLKDAQDQLLTRQTALSMKLLDSAVVLTALRDDIKNQRYVVEEAEMTFRNSKYEPPTTIREAEIKLDKSKRTLEQLQRSYSQVHAQNKTDIVNQTYWFNKVSKRVADLEEVLAQFTVRAPSSGMVIYKREWSGAKRKAGSMINPFDKVVATLPDLTTMLSKTYVNEIDVSKIKSGQKVDISIDAFPAKRFNGTVMYVANIGEKLTNSNDKVFEVQVKVEGSDPQLRPSMTTGNKIMIKTVNDAVYIPIECVQAGIDSIPFVYTKKGVRQIVLLGDSNEKNILVEKGLDPGTKVYLTNPENAVGFKVEGKELIDVIRSRQKALNDLAGMYRKKPANVL
jgi:multidrug efflux pump subunit AcrA (membrane-fusion protein)